MIDRALPLPLLLAAPFAALLALAACSAALPDEALIRQGPPAQLAELAPPLQERVASHPDDDGALRRLALLEVRLGRTEAAVTHALRAVQAEPFRGENQLVLGETYEAAGKPVRALAAYAQAIALDPNLVVAYVRHAAVQATLHDRDKALHTLDEALRREPRHFGARLLRARLLRDLGRLPEAVVAIEAARAVRPDDGDALRLHVEILQARGQLAAAVRLAEQGLVRRPGERSLLELLARLQREQGDWNGALRTLARLERQGALTPQQRLLRVEALTGQGSEPQASAALEALLHDHPDFAPAHVRLAERLVRSSQGREALREAQQGAALAPQSAEAHYWEAVAHYTIDERSLGDAAVAVAVRLEPEQTAVQLLRIGRMLADFRLDAAAPLLDRLQEGEPELAPALLLRSELAVLQGELELATQLLDRLPPTFAPEQVRFARLRIAYVQGNWPKVQELSEPLLEHPLLGWRATYLRASAQLRQGRWEDGIALVRPYLESPRRRVLFHHLAGYLFLLQGDRAAAQRAFLAGLALEPGNALMIEGLSRMAMEAQDWARAEELLQQGLQAPDGYRALFLERLIQVSQARRNVQLGRETLLRFLERTDPARGGRPPQPASAVLYGAYFPPYDLRPTG